MDKVLLNFTFHFAFVALCFLRLFVIHVFELQIKREFVGLSLSLPVDVCMLCFEP